MPLLEVRGVTLRFGGLAALSDVSFDVEPGTIHGLIGPNGAGKSTIFNCISRLYQPNTGTLHFEGQDLLQRAPHQVMPLGISRTFQNLGLFGRLPVEDNVLVGLHTRLPGGFTAHMLRLRSARQAERQAREQVRQVLGELGLLGLAQHPASGLAYGILKRIELARALVSRPKLLLLDEPAAGLNPTEKAELGQRLKGLRGTGMTVLLVEHDMSLVMDVCDRITVLDFGRVVADGTPAQVRSNPAVIEAYLGEVAS